MISVQQVTVYYGVQRALGRVNFEARRGELVGLFGPNGSGKTTLLKVLAGLQVPTGGSVAIGGYSPRQDGDRIRRLLGMVGHGSHLYEDLTARENLEFYAVLYGCSDGAARAEGLLQRVGLWKERDQRVRTLSRGMKKRLSLAKALLHDPRVLLLDEPYAALDEASVRLLNDLLAGFRGEGGTGVIATHDHPRALAICDRVVVLLEGRVVFERPRPEVPREEFRSLYAELTGGPVA